MKTKKTPIFIILILAWTIISLVSLQGFAEATELSQDFESGIGGWSTSGLWRINTSTTSPCISPYEGTASAAYNLASTCKYDNGSANSGDLISPAILIPASASSPTLSFYTYEVTENSASWDHRYVNISIDGGTTWPDNLYTSTVDITSWTLKTYDLSAYKGKTIKIRFRFDTGDPVNNGYPGWYIDLIKVTGSEFAPTIDTNSGITVMEGSTGNIIKNTNLASSDDSDAPATLTYTLKSLPANGTLYNNSVAFATTGQTFTQGDIDANKITYNHNGSETTSDNFKFTVKDSDGGETAGTFNITVTPVNDAPSGTDKTITTLEETDYTFATADFGFTDPNDSPPNSLLAVKITTIPGAGSLKDNGTAVTAGTFIAVADITGGKLKFSPTANGNGSPYTTFTFQVQDDGGTANGGVDLDQSPNTMTINVTSVNDAPAGTDKTVTTNEDTSYTFAAADFGFTDPNDSPANSLLAVKITTLPNVALGTLKKSGVDVTAGAFVALADLSGNLKFNPVANANGSTTFTFQVQDNGGILNGGVDLDQSPNTMTINVTPVNDAPVAVDDTATVVENNSIVIPVLLNDTDVDVVTNGQILSVASIDKTTYATLGTITNNGTNVTYSADAFDYLNAGVSYNDKFKYTVSDGNGGTATATVTVTVTGVNDAPVVGGIPNQTILEGATFATINLDTYVSDVDNTASQMTWSYSGNSSLTVSISASRVATITIPNLDWNGSETITFKATDPGLLSSSQAVTFTVTPVNDKPSFTASNPAAVLEDAGAQSITGWATFSAGPSNEATQSVKSYNISSISNSALFSALPAVNTSGTLTYTPATHAYGTSTFNVSVTDTGGTANGGVDTSDTQTFTITVKPTHTLTINWAMSGTGSVTGSAVTLQSLSPFVGRTDTGTTGNTVTYTCQENDIVKLSATAALTPSAGSVFKGWSGDASGTGNVTLTMAADKTVTAKFVQRYNVTPSASPVGEGTISPSTQQIIESGGSITFTITPNYCWYIVDVLDNGVSQGGLAPTDPYAQNSKTYTVSNITADHTIQADFGQNTYTITSTADTGGDIEPAGPVVITCGGNYTYTITPDNSNNYYAVKQVLVDGVQVIGETNGTVTYTFTNASTSHTINAVFEDHGTGCSAATPIPVSAPSSSSQMWGSIDTAGDKDFYKLVIPTGGVLKVYTTGNTDTYGYLLDSNCNVISTGVTNYDDIAGTNANFKIVMLAIPAGTYYIEVKDYFDDQTGIYQLNVQYDAKQFGSSCDTAYPMTCGTAINGTIATGGAMDFFSVTLPGDGILTAWTTGATDTFGVLYNSNCQEMDQQDSGGAGTNFKMKDTLPAGTYYIEVKDSNANGTGAYQLNVSCTITYNIYAEADTGGLISPYGTVTLASGGSQAFTVTATGGNTILQVMVDNVAVSGATGLTSYTYTFTNVIKGHSITATFNLPPGACVDINDIPLDARFQAAPANIMFLLDDSGSMNWEILDTTSGATSDGTFMSYNYVFDNAGDNLYSGVIPSTKRMYWKSQWAGENMMYYDPSNTYTPWPTLSNANPNNPKSHPEHTTPTLNMDNIYYAFATGTGGATTIEVDDGDTTGWAMSPTSQTVIIDDTDSGCKLSTNPSWTASATSSQAYNSEYYYTTYDKNHTNNTYTATWTPPAGTYYVYARWDAESVNSTSVTYTINYGSSQNVKTIVDQTSNGGKWVALGGSTTSYTFNGSTNNVQINAFKPTSTSGRAVADAVRFIPTGPHWDWATSDDAEGGEYLYSAVASTTTPYTATWTPTIATAGKYNVYVNWVNSADSYTRATNVPYKVTYSGGTATVTEDQTQQSGQWVLLGTYQFATGTAGKVSMTYTVSDLTHTVCADAVKFVPADTTPATVNIRESHYYVWSTIKGKPYLVNINGTTGQIEYYLVNDANSNNFVDKGELTQDTNPPADVVTGRTYAQERQNFANYYSFYRRRILTAIDAIANVVTGIQGVNIGFYSINQHLIQPVLPTTQSGTLLNTLYNFTPQAEGTPLRLGLQSVGQYYNADDGKTGGIGNSPYATAANGGECQQAFTIVVTDGFDNGSVPSYSYAGYTTSDQLNFDKNSGVPYADTYSNSLADTAMYYYANDQSLTLANLVPTSSVDTAYWQHMVTYTVSFGEIGTLNPSDYDDNLKNKTTGSSIVWPNFDDGNDLHKIDDLWHAAVNGRGKFLPADNPAALVTSLLSIMQSIQGRIGSASSVSVNGDELYETLTTGVKMFQASYNSSGWTGDVKAYPVDPVTGAVNMETFDWSAASRLQTQNWDTNRMIVTYYDDGTTRKGVPFRYANLTATQKTSLVNTWDTSTSGPQNLLNYLRGDSTNETTLLFRARSQKLGDIVHSSPLHKNGILYAGGNDGMLHAFAAVDSTSGNGILGGQELFAYIPNIVFGNLKKLADPNYGLVSHTFFVDLTPSTADLNRTDRGVTTMLAGGLGKGGKGYYALNISGLSNNAFSIANETAMASLVMWEYPNSSTTTSDINDIGYSFSRPAIVMSNAPDPYDASKPRWVVIVGNGYDSQNGHAVLFILDAITGELLKKIDTGAGGCNGLSTPVTIDVPVKAKNTTFDSKIDYVYAGDMKGNLWKFNLTSSNINDWGISYKNGTNTPQPVFQAKSPGGLTQRITTKPDVMLHPTENFGYMVVFGTGSYLGDSDLSNTTVQTIYGIWDYGDDADPSEYIGSFNRGSTPQLSNMPSTATLLQQTVVQCNPTSTTTCSNGYWLVNGQETMIVSSLTPDWKTSITNQDHTACGDYVGGDSCEPNGIGDNPDPVRNVGWYFDLPDEGERVVTDVSLRGGIAIAIGYIPKQSPCGAGGTSIFMELNAATGGQLNTPAFDLNGDAVINSNDLINIGKDTSGNPIMAAASGIQYSGRLLPPAILRVTAGTEMKYSSSSRGTIQTIMERAVRMGISYWMEYEE